MLLLQPFAIPKLTLVFHLRNAKIAGMVKELHMVGNDYNVAVTMFTVAYVIFGVPANLLVKKFGPRMLVLYMFTWGEAAFLCFNWECANGRSFGRAICDGSGLDQDCDRADRVPIFHGDV